MAKKYKPFATERQFMDWIAKNCDTCKKGYNSNRSIKYKCELEYDLDAAYCVGDQITEAVARAIGYLDSEGCDLWECPGWQRGRK